MSTHIKPAAPATPPVPEVSIEDFPLEDGIAPPPKRSTTKYPFAKMKVGQSFFVAEAASPGKNVRASISNYKKVNAGWGYSAASVDKPVKGIRVWCIATPEEEAKTG